MAQDLFDHVTLRWLDEADNLHARAAPRADQWIDLPDLLDEGGPAATGEAARCMAVVDLDDVAVLAVGLGAQAAGLVGIPAERAAEVLSGVGDVLSESCCDRVSSSTSASSASSSAWASPSFGSSTPRRTIFGDLSNVDLRVARDLRIVQYAGQRVDQYLFELPERHWWMRPEPTRQQ